MPEPSEMAIKNLERMLAQDPLLSDLMSSSLPRSRKSGRFTPEVDVIECDDHYVVLLDVPGVTRESLDVELDGSRLIVRGERASGHPETGKVRTGERSHGKFKRVFLLPSQVRGEQVEAHLDNGVLRVTVPTSGRARRIKVEVA